MHLAYDQILFMKREVERLKENMYSVAAQHGENYHHPAVVEASQRVDRALSAYDRFKSSLKA